MKKYLPVNIPAIEFIRRLSSCDGISVTRMFLVVIYLIKLILVMPVALVQFLFYNKRISKTVITKPPVFILGHYRSGTTYLQKLMAADPRFGFISSYDIICPNSSLLCGTWLKKTLQLLINFFRIKTSFYNNHIPDLDEPAEEERYFINKGSAFTDYWRFVFPLCWYKWKTCSQLLNNADYYKHWNRQYTSLLKMATFKHKGKQLLLKSPPNTERIKYLLEMFPNAKFIYISRDPYHVFYSTCNMWKKAIAKFWLQKISKEQIEEIVFNEYIHMAERYEKDKKLIPVGNLIEVGYDDLETDPIDLLQVIYTKLNLPDFKTAKAYVCKKLEEEKQYQKFEYAYSEEVFKKIDRRWAKYINRWNEKTIEVFINEYA